MSLEFLLRTLLASRPSRPFDSNVWLGCSGRELDRMNSGLSNSLRTVFLPTSSSASIVPPPPPSTFSNVVFPCSCSRTFASRFIQRVADIPVLTALCGVRPGRIGKLQAENSNNHSTRGAAGDGKHCSQ